MYVLYIQYMYMYVLRTIHIYIQSTDIFVSYCRVQSTDTYVVTSPRGRSGGRISIFWGTKKNNRNMDHQILFFSFFFCLCVFFFYACLQERRGELNQRKNSRLRVYFGVSTYIMIYSMYMYMYSTGLMRGLGYGSIICTYITDT